jgi:hypothetical protein
MHATLPLLQTSNFPALSRKRLSTLQVNLGYLCNQSCVHCHVDAGPHRTEMMSDGLIDTIGQVLQTRKIETLDLTGGAPELHQGFKRIVTEARAQGVRVIDRCNLTILFEPGQEDLAEFLAAQKVEIVASMPCYSLENVDKQRGKGVFDLSIAALQKLNALGYGHWLDFEFGLQPAGPKPAAQPKQSAGGLQTRTFDTLWHCVQRIVCLDQHAHQKVWVDADFQKNLCTLHAIAARQFFSGKPRACHVPQYC